MDHCCNAQAQAKQKKHILIAVLIINALMFLVQYSAAIVAHSTSLMADSLDMLGDAITYGISLYAAYRGGLWLAKAALFKGGIIAIFAIGILLDALKRILIGHTLPQSDLMIIFSCVGLLANGVCLYLLTTQRNKDINMKSTWICSRNDILVNLSVLVTAGFVILMHSRWPDIIVGIGLATLLGYSSISIIRNSRAMLQRQN